MKQAQQSHKHQSSGSQAKKTLVDIRLARSGSVYFLVFGILVLGTGHRAIELGERESDAAIGQKLRVGCHRSQQTGGRHVQECHSSPNVRPVLGGVIQAEEEMPYDTQQHAVSYCKNLSSDTASVTIG